MAESNPDDPLLEWNRLNRENAEHDFTSALFQSMSETSPLVEKFSMWLFAGTGATAALLISQIESTLPYLSEKGFKVCLIILLVSAASGFVAKYFSLRCEIQNRLQSKLIELLKPVLKKHEEDEYKIQEYAKQKGIPLQTDINFSNIMNEFSRPFPFWIKWIISRKVDKNSGDRQAGFHLAAQAYIPQILWTFSQAFLFLVFILMAAWYSNAI